MPIPIENNSWDYVQGLIEKEINSAFKLREAPAMPTKKEIKKMTTKTSFGEYFDIQRDKIVKDMQDKNKQQNVEWMERYEKRKKMAKEMIDAQI